MISYLTATIQPFDIQNLWYCALTLLIKKSYDFWSPSFLVFLSLQTWEVTISEMGWLGPILDSKLIPVVHIVLLEHQKLDKMILQQPEYAICTRKYSYNS